MEIALFVAFAALFGAMLFRVVLSLFDKHVEYDLVERIAHAIKRASTNGTLTPSTAVSGAPLRQVAIVAYDLSAVCGWPVEWPPEMGGNLPLLRMFTGTFGPSQCAGYCKGTFTISHGIGSNPGRPVEHMICYDIDGTTVTGVAFAFQGTMTIHSVDLEPHVGALSSVIDVCAAHLNNTTNPA